MASADLVPIPRISGHPVLGHLRDFRADRVAVQLRVAREQPEIARLRIGLIPVVMIGAPTLAHEVLALKHTSFVKAPGLAIFLRPLLGRGLLTSEREVHTRQRKLIAPAFAHKRISSYASIMAQRSERFAASLESGRVLDVSEGILRLTLEIVGKTLFDAEVGSDADEVGHAVTVAMECAMAQLSSLVPIPPFVPTPTNLRNRRAVAQLDAILYRIIREKGRVKLFSAALLEALCDVFECEPGQLLERTRRVEAGRVRSPGMAVTSGTT